MQAALLRALSCLPSVAESCALDHLGLIRFQLVTADKYDKMETPHTRKPRTMV
jgi:hypothetical protein